MTYLFCSSCRRYDDIWVFRDSLCEELLFGIDILKHDIEGDPFHSDRLEFFDQIGIERFSYSEILQVRSSLETIQARVIYFYDGDISRWFEVILVEPV